MVNVPVENANFLQIKRRARRNLCCEGHIVEKAVAEGSGVICVVAGGSHDAVAGVILRAEDLVHSGYHGRGGDQRG